MIDFIPVSEYAHYFDVTVLCMVLTAVWQCHTGSVLKKETVSLNAMWGVLFTSCQRLFRRHGKLRQRILYCSQLTRSLFLAMGRRMVVLQPYAMVCQIQRHPYFFPAMCHCLYRFIVAGYATYLQRVLLYSFLSHTQHVYFLELRSKRYPEWHGSLLVHLGNDVCQPSTRNDRVMRVGSRNPQIHLSDGWSRHTDLVHQE